MTGKRSRAVRTTAIAGSVIAVGTAGVWGVAQVLDGVERPWRRGASCEATADGATFAVSPAQMANVATIVGIAERRRLPARAATIALATARQESKFVNLDYGDRDSLGLFQQRPSQGWGDPDQLMDPVYSTNAFYDALVKIDDYRSREVTDVAQQVQRSAFPQAYADHEAEGRVYASALSGNSPAALTCRIDEDSRPSGKVGVQPYLWALGREQARVPTQRMPDVAGVRLAAGSRRSAWSLAHWSVASAGRLGVARVVVDGRVWDRSDPDAGWAQSASPASTSTEVVVLFQSATTSTS
ncbi:MAG: hypothetical protein ACRC35_01905 [Angustibacter sp.]